MTSLGWLAGLGLALAATAAATVVQAAPPAPAVISDISLAAPFGAGSAWRFTAVQDAPVSDPFDAGGDKLPGRIRLCLSKGAAAPCDPQLRDTLQAASPDGLFSEPHTLDTAQIVRPPAAAGPLLLVQTASLSSGDGDQSRLTQMLAYQHGPDRFVRVYEHLTGRNNNQEVRYVATGRLGGAIVSAEPTGDAPFGFWISVNTIAAGQAYRQVLRYRSATGYADGNPLPVIDSEMPNIQRRLGLWRPGSPMPLPPGPCPKPHLIRLELWCG